jgi:Excinuclease ATPase subunit
VETANGDWILVHGAREKNLKNVHARIPKKKITVFTGVSGSGKSALVFDTIAAESQRQLNETYSSFIRQRLPHYGQPEVDAIEHLPVAIVMNQKRIGGNARSTVGTASDIYSLLRLLYSRIGQPFVGYSDVFSFNNPQGMCPRCEGLGTARVFRIDRLIDREKSLNEGAIRFPTFEPGGFRWKRYVCTGLFDNDKKLKDYTEDEWDTLLYKSGFKPPNPTDGWPPSAKYEGVIPRIERSLLNKDSREARLYKEAIERIVDKGPCPDCGGARLNANVLECRINGLSIADCTRMQISELAAFIRTIREPSASTVTEALLRRLEHFIEIGLGYISLNRETSTLSGGESQRMKMARQLGSSLTDLTYIFDEPSIGLHPHDVSKINRILIQLKEKGNTVIIVEHDPDVIAIADHVIDMGPQAGTKGGTIVYEGDLPGLMQAETLTGRFLNRAPQIKREVRKPQGWMPIRGASLHNLKNVDVDIPRGVMTVVTGVAGSGKSTLIRQVFPQYYPEAVFIDQSAIQASSRSNIATFAGIFDVIRSRFARATGADASMFSFNSQGACPQCKGLGIVHIDLAFMDAVETVCEACGGRRFREETLRLTWRGKNIAQVLELTVDEALDDFDEREMVYPLRLLSEAGLGYMTLGQPLSSLSGGELQRVKLATELAVEGNIYVLDEPTTGLHLSDIERLMRLMNRLVDQGATLIVIEHHLDVIGQADWIIDLGPGAGYEGGNVLFQGPPEELIHCHASITGRYLKRYAEGGSRE